MGHSCGISWVPIMFLNRSSRYLGYHHISSPLYMEYVVICHFLGGINMYKPPNRSPGAKENGYRQLWSLDQLCQDGVKKDGMAALHHLGYIYINNYKHDIYIYTHICMYIYIYVCLYIYIYNIYRCIYVYMYVYIYINIQNTYWTLYIYTYIYIYVMCVHIYIYIYIYI